MGKKKTKQWYESKVLWFNGLTLLAAVLSALADELALAGTLTVISVVNILLRVVTTQALAFGEVK